MTSKKPSSKSALPPPKTNKHVPPAAEDDNRLLEQLTWDDPIFRRYLEDNPAEKSRLIKQRRKEEEYFAAWVFSVAAEDSMRRMNEEWDALPAEERAARYQQAMDAGRQEEERIALLGRDWSGVRSTDGLPSRLMQPVFEFILKHRNIILRFVDMSQRDIDDISRGLGIPIESFRAALLFMGGNDPIAIALKTGDYALVNSVNALADKILAAWNSSTLSGLKAAPTEGDLQRLAVIAAKISIAQFDERRPATTDAGRIIDPVTGLVLPPEPGLPYRERGHQPNGIRLNIFEHLRREYGAYLDAHLLFSGHLQDIDKPAYDALLYLARKDARLKNLEDSLTHTAEFFLEHGILAGEHLEFPPEHLTRQVDVINQSRAASIVPRIRGRRKVPSRSSSR